MLDQGDVRDQALLEHEGLAVDGARLLAFGDQRTRAHLGIEAVNSGAAGPDALRQRTLRIEFELQFAGEVLALEFLVLADVR